MRERRLAKKELSVRKDISDDDATLTAERPMKVAQNNTSDLTCHLRTDST